MTLVITDNLDRLEAALPTIPARVVRLQRTLAGAACDRTASAVTDVVDSARSLYETARTSMNTVTGQTRAAGRDLAKTAGIGVSTVAGQVRSATDNVASTARVGVKTVTGQAGAQARTVSSAAERETLGLLDDALEAIDDAIDDKPGTGTPYEDWTKAELVERAKELDVPRAYAMNKPELIKALRK